MTSSPRTKPHAFSFSVCMSGEIGCKRMRMHCQLTMILDHRLCIFLQELYEVQLETFIGQNRQLWQLKVLQPILQQPKMDIYKHQQSLLSQCLFLVIPYPQTTYLWSRSSDIPLCKPLPRHGSIFVCVLIMEERSYSATCYKYCRTDGNTPTLPHLSLLLKRMVTYIAFMLRISGL